VAPALAAAVSRVRVERVKALVESEKSKQTSEEGATLTARGAVSYQPATLAAASYYQPLVVAAKAVGMPVLAQL
jgi:hypothetical protein